MLPATVKLTLWRVADAIMGGPRITLVPACLESSCDKVVVGGDGDNRGGSATRRGPQSVLSVPSSQRSSSDAPEPPSWPMSSAPPHVSRHFEATPATASASANVVQMHASHNSLARSSEEAGVRLLRPRGAAHRERDMNASPHQTSVGPPLANGFAPSWAVVGRVCRACIPSRQLCETSALLCAVGNEWEIIHERT